MKGKAWLAAIPTAGLLLVLFEFYGRNQGLRAEAERLTQELIAADRAQEVGVPAPDARFRTIAGEEVDLARASKAGTLLLFFSVRCPACEEQAAGWREHNPEPGAAGPKVVGISLGERQETLDFARRHGLGFPILLDEDRTLRKHFAVRTTPHFLFLDSGGVSRLRDPLWTALQRKRRPFDAGPLNEPLCLAAGRRVWPEAARATWIDLDGARAGVWALEGEGKVLGFARFLSEPIHDASLPDVEALALFHSDGKLASLFPLAQRDLTRPNR